MLRVGVLLVRVLIPRVLRVVILRVREEYLENTLRARTRAYAHARHALVAPLVTLDDHGLPPLFSLAYAYGRIMHARTRRRLLSTRKKQYIYGLTNLRSKLD